jgi:hypothetical protein
VAFGKISVRIVHALIATVLSTVVVWAADESAANAKSNLSKSNVAKSNLAKSNSSKETKAHTTAAKKSASVTSKVKPPSSKTSGAGASSGRTSTHASETAGKPSAGSSKKTASAGKRSPSKNGKPIVAAAPRRPGQQQPTAERYKEIQEALSSRGYFSGPVDGTWGMDSSDALRRFQHDQNLPEDGKIGSLSLIALGLGPRRTARNDPTQIPPPLQP